MNKKERAFVDSVWAFYRAHGRHGLPWRRRSHLEPYHVLVSEVMLQQTQASRVVPKYLAFLKRFPSARSLASAPLSDVLREWQGLGYNRRAKLLQETAKAVVGVHRGRFPRTYEGLLALPGVGPYTAGAVAAFAYNAAVPVIETNFRTVFIHHFGKRDVPMSDAEVLRLVARTLDRERPREWYWAIMDYGAHLKRTVGNHRERSASYVKQAKFEGSDRQLRGAILRELSRGSSRTLAELVRNLSGYDPERTEAQLVKLEREGMLVHRRGRYSLPS